MARNTAIGIGFPADPKEKPPGLWAGRFHSLRLSIGMVLGKSRMVEFIHTQRGAAYERKTYFTITHKYFILFPTDFLRHSKAPGG